MYSYTRMKIIDLRNMAEIKINKKEKRNIALCFTYVNTAYTLFAFASFPY